MHLISRVVRGAIAAALGASLLAAFLIYSSLDLAVPHGTRTILAVSAVSSQTSDTDLYDTVHSAAAANNANVYKVVARPASTASQVYFGFIGAPGRETAFTNSYPAFVPSASIGVRPASELTTQDARGIYTMDVDGDSADRIIDALSAAGADVRTESVDSSYIAQRALDGGALISTIAGVLLALALALTQATSRQKTIEAVKEVHGHSASRIFGAEVLFTTLWFLAIAAIELAVLVIFLFFYNGLNQASDFAGVVLVAVVACYVAVMILVCGVFCFTPHSGLLPALRGKRPLAFVATIAVLVQVVSALVLIAAASQLANRAEVVMADTAGNARWEAEADLVAVRLGQGLADDGLDAAGEKLGPLVRELDSRGEVVLSYGHPGASARQGYGPDDGNRIVVNSLYLAQQTVLDADGERVEAPALVEGGMLLLIPAQLEDRVPALVEEYRSFAEFQSSLFEGSSSVIDIDVRLIADGQRQFNYSDGTQGSVVQTDAAIAVVDMESNILPDSYYVAAASNGSLLFTNADTVKREVEQRGLSRLVLSVYNAGDIANAALSKAVREVTIAFASAILLVLVFVFAVSVFSLAHTSLRRAVQVNQRMLGFTFVEIHWRYLLTTAAGAASVIGISVVLGTASGTGAVVAVLLGAAGYALIVVALHAYARRSSREWTHEQ